MTVRDDDLKIIREQVKKALIEGIRQADKGHYITKARQTALITISIFEGGVSSTSIVGVMDESPIYGAMEKTRFLIHDIVRNQEIENEVNKVVAQIEAQQEAAGLRVKDFN